MMRSRSKTCPVCEAGSRVLDYKDDRTLSRFLTDRGKILPSRLSGMCARHQRQLSTAIKLDESVLRFLVVLAEEEPAPPRVPLESGAAAAAAEEEDE